MNESGTPVAVFGTFFNANFGDDLMGHMLAGALLHAGYHPRLWRGPASPYQGHTWETCTSMDSFLREARCVVIAGGVVFSNSGLTPYWNDLHSLVEACEKRNCPIIAISIGSHGNYTHLNPAALQLVKSPMLKAVSVRIEQDVNWLHQFNKQARYIPDIVLTAFSARPHTRIRKVLLCLAVHPLEHPLLHLTVRRLQAHDLEVSTVSQITDGAPGAESFFHTRDTRKYNRNLDDIAALLQETDVLVGTGLHTGLAALSAGAIFISYRGHGKTVAFMQANGLDKYVIANQGGKFTKIGSSLQLYRMLRTLLPLPGTVQENLQHLQQQAAQHRTFMLENIPQRIQ